MQLYANNPTHRSTIHNNNKAFSRSSWCTPIHKLRRQTEGLAEAEVSKHKESTSSKSTSPATSVWERSPDIPPSSSRVSEAPWQRPPNSPPLSQAVAKCPPPRGEVLNAPLQVMTSWTATSAVPSANPSVCRRNSWMHGRAPRGSAPRGTRKGFIISYCGSMCVVRVQLHRKSSHFWLKVAVSVYLTKILRPSLTRAIFGKAQLAPRYNYR